MRDWTSEELTSLLHRHWGYQAFRPRQEEIIRSILSGRDVALIMPTGGGKSLCYQLPAVAMGKTCVVVSPLIALMQDQVVQLERAGIPAGFLNSSQEWPAQQRVVRRAESGELRLLYLAPERLVRPDTLDWLQSLPVGFFAVDEAHCISEWGHEFRPEYRQLRRLRDLFPDHSIAAFTASATRQVRHDIVAQLHLRDPAKFALSFQRPNLKYIVRPCTQLEQRGLLLACLRALDGRQAVVYSSTTRGVDDTVDVLVSEGFTAIGYHGKMESEERQANQELWMSGKRQVMVGTIAFGLGINKRDVRAVIHLSLPKSIEQYYQEAGRAGRDGEPAECVLLWQKRDTALLAHFINEIQLPEERERAWQRYHAIKRYAEAVSCRQHLICRHFGEQPRWEKCGACDACGWQPAWLEEGARPAAAPRRRKKKAASNPEGQGNTDARARLRTWRLEIAKSLSMPAYVVLHDSTIDEICRQSPASLDELLEIRGIGQRKVDQFGEAILSVLRGTE